MKELRLRKLINMWVWIDNKGMLKKTVLECAPRSYMRYVNYLIGGRLKKINLGGMMWKNDVIPGIVFGLPRLGIEV